MIGVLWWAITTITNLAHENGAIKTLVRTKEGIPLLKYFLELTDTKVQQEATSALWTLALKNEPNKNQIVECHSLPTIILMIHYNDVGIHNEVVGVIGNSVHSFVNIKKEVLAGALQPIIGQLSSRCHESQTEVALLLGKFSTIGPKFKVDIIQREVVWPLSNML